MSNANNKYLYSFTDHKKEGEKQIPYKIHLLKPTRKLREAGELFYSGQVSYYVKNGIMPRAVLEKHLLDGGGIESEGEKEKYLSIRDRLNILEVDYNMVALKGEAMRTEDESKKLIECLREITELKRESIGLELNKLSAFEHSAEAKARNKTILWWIVNLTQYEKDEQEPLALFTGKTVDNKFDQYDQTMEDDEQEFWQAILGRISYLLTFWWVGTAYDEETFKDADKLFNKEEGPAVPEPAVESAAPESTTVETPKVELERSKE